MLVYRGLCLTFPKTASKVATKNIEKVGLTQFTINASRVRRETKGQCIKYNVCMSIDT